MGFVVAVKTLSVTLQHITSYYTHTRRQKARKREREEPCYQGILSQSIKSRGGSEPSIIDEDGGRSAVKQPGTPDCAPASVTAIVFLKCFSIDMGLSLEPQYAA